MKLYVAAILLICFLENFEVYLIRGAVGSQTIPRSTCLSWYKGRIKSISFVDYKRLENLPKEGVLLTTRRGVKICVLLDHVDLKKIMDNVDNKEKRRKHKRTIDTSD